MFIIYRHIIYLFKLVIFHSKLFRTGGLDSTLRQGSIVPLSRQPRCQGFDAAQASPCQQGTAAPRRGEKRLETFELLHEP